MVLFLRSKEAALNPLSAAFPCRAYSTCFLTYPSCGKSRAYSLHSLPIHATWLSSWCSSATERPASVRAAVGAAGGRAPCCAVGNVSSENRQHGPSWHTGRQRDLGMHSSGYEVNLYVFRLYFCIGTEEMSLRGN